MDDATLQWKRASTTLRDNAAKAVKHLEKKVGKISTIQKLSGGDEPKTDLVVRGAQGTVKCSLKYGGFFQLSSSGIHGSVGFLSKVLESVKRRVGYDAKLATKILDVLAELDKKYGDLGKMPAAAAQAKLGKAEHYNDVLKQLLGTSKNPSVAQEYDDFKMAIIREAMTGKFTFANVPIKSADHILSEKEIVPITEAVVRKAANKTSVRLALKGRGTVMMGKKETRLNEIVVRFDTKA